MKAVINGFRYNTDKAIKVGEISSDVNISSLHYWKASLYVSPRAGRYFLAGEGGAMTRFASCSGAGESYQSWHGERIIPMSKAEAVEWAEQYLTADEIEVGFKDAIQDA